MSDCVCGRADMWALVRARLNTQKKFDLGPLYDAPSTLHAISVFGVRFDI